MPDISTLALVQELDASLHANALTVVVTPPTAKPRTNAAETAPGYRGFVHMVVRHAPQANLTPEEEQDLIRTVRLRTSSETDRREATARLIEAHTSWMNAIARDLSDLFDVPQNTSLPVMVTALLETIQDYSLWKRTRLTLFAQYRVVGAVLQEVAKTPEIGNAKLQRVIGTHRARHLRQTAHVSSGLDDIDTEETFLVTPPQDIPVAQTRVKALIAGFLSTLTRPEQVIWEARTLTEAAGHKPHGRHTLGILFDATSDQIQQIEADLNTRFQTFLRQQGIGTVQDVF